MCARTEVCEIALLIEGNYRILGKVVYKLHLVRLAFLFHEFNSLCARKLKALQRQVLLTYSLHFLFDSLQIFLCQLGFSEVNVVVKAGFICRTVCETRMRIEASDSLRHDMSGAVSEHVKLFFGSALIYSSV